MAEEHPLHQAIDDVIAAPADRLVEEFFAPEGSFAGTTFDDLGDNPPFGISASDLVAVSLLDVPFGPRAVRALMSSEHNDFTTLLVGIPESVDLWDATDEDLSPAYALWEALGRLPGVGPTRTSKLLARKRPRLIPIIDSVIREHLPLGEDSWVSLRAALQDEVLRKSIEEIRPPSAGGSISTLRLLDAATWMKYSGSRAARKARRRSGLSNRGVDE